MIVLVCIQFCDWRIRSLFSNFSISTSMSPKTTTSGSGSEGVFFDVHGYYGLKRWDRIGLFSSWLSPHTKVNCSGILIIHMKNKWKKEKKLQHTQLSQKYFPMCVLLQQYPTSDLLNYFKLNTMMEDLFLIWFISFIEGQNTYVLFDSTL